MKGGREKRIPALATKWRSEARWAQATQKMQAAMARGRERFDAAFENGVFRYRDPWHPPRRNRFKDDFYAR